MRCQYLPSPWDGCGSRNLWRCLAIVPIRTTTELWQDQVLSRFVQQLSFDKIKSVRDLLKLEQVLGTRQFIFALKLPRCQWKRDDRLRWLALSHATCQLIVGLVQSLQLQVYSVDYLDFADDDKSMRLPHWSWRVASGLVNFWLYSSRRMPTSSEVLIIMNNLVKVCLAIRVVRQLDLWPLSRPNRFDSCICLIGVEAWILREVIGVLRNLWHLWSWRVKSDFTPCQFGQMWLVWQLTSTRCNKMLCQMNSMRSSRMNTLRSNFWGSLTNS
jgi:hypothetical protein